VRRPLVLEKLDREDFPGQLGLFARDVTTFLHCLNEFPEFTDEALNASILAFEGDLKVCAVVIYLVAVPLTLLLVLGFLLEGIRGRVFPLIYFIFFWLSFYRPVQVSVCSAVST